MDFSSLAVQLQYLNGRSRSRYHVADLFDEASDWGTPHIDVCFDQFANVASGGDLLVKTLS